MYPCCCARLPLTKKRDCLPSTELYLSNVSVRHWSEIFFAVLFKSHNRKLKAVRIRELLNHPLSVSEWARRVYFSLVRFKRVCIQCYAMNSFSSCCFFLLLFLHFFLLQNRWNKMEWVLVKVNPIKYNILYTRIVFPSLQTKAYKKLLLLIKDNAHIFFVKSQKLYEMNENH